MTAVEIFFNDLVNQGFIEYKDDSLVQNIFNAALELEKQQMLEFGSKITDRWGLTRVEPQYIEDEYNKQYKSE